MQLRLLILIIGLFTSCACAAPQTTADEPRADALLDEVWGIVNEQFFDPAFKGVDWHAAKRRFAARLDDSMAAERAAEVINEMLKELGASHTRLYLPETVEYHELVDIYREALGDDLRRVFPDGIVHYSGFGVAGQPEQDGSIVLTDVYEAGTALNAGLRPGDRFVMIRRGQPDDPPPMCGTFTTMSPMLAFKGGVGMDVTLVVRRGSAKEPLRRAVTLRDIVPHELFLESMRRSARVIERDDRRLAYVRLRSWAGEEYQNLLIELLNAEPLRSCDGLILDLRGGWGGANPEYLSVFGCGPPTLEMSNREGQINRIAKNPDNIVPVEQQWRKPVTLLIDEGTRSGKEIFTYAFKKAGRGKVVGTRTAGAVLGGRPFLLSDGSLLVVAVSDVRVDGVRLEGVGVEPDVVVDRGPIELSAGADPQLERAVSVLSQALVSDR